jgi:cobalt-zinc-cadmium efflux system outer membrane protein
MYKFLTALALAASWPAHAFAQAAHLPDIPAGAHPGFATAIPVPDRLSLGAALDLVLRNNRQLASAQREIQAQDGAVSQAGALPNPELSGLVEDTRRATRVTTVQINQQVELGGKRGARVTAAERAREAAVAELAAIRGELSAVTRRAFIDLLAAQAQQRSAEESVNVAHKALAAVAKRVRAGSNSPVDETRARVAASGARLDLAQSNNEVANARTRLAVLWGGTGDDVRQVDGALDLLPEVEPLGQLMSRLDHAPAVLRATAELRRRQAGTDVERARRIPDITVSVGTKRDEQIGRTQAIFGLAIPLPVFDRNQGRLQEALERSEGARDDLAVARSKLQSELAQAYGQLEAARGQIRVLRSEILPDSESAYNAAQTGFEFGKFDFLNLIDAQRTLLEANSRHVRALAEVHRAASDIERIVGQPGRTDARMSTLMKP